MKILAFGYKKRVGKDQAAKFIISHLRTTRRGINIQSHGFADELKAMCFRLYSWAGLMPASFYEQLGNERFKEEVLPALGKSPRQIWIEFGMSVRKIFDRTWPMFLFNNVHCDILLIKDLRFIDEAEMILEQGGYVIRIDNPEVELSDDAADIALDNWDGWSHVLLNDGSLNLFYEKVTELADQLL